MGKLGERSRKFRGGSTPPPGIQTSLVSCVSRSDRKTIGEAPLPASGLEQHLALLPGLPTVADRALR